VAILAARRERWYQGIAVRPPCGWRHFWATSLSDSTEKSIREISTPTRLSCTSKTTKCPMDAGQRPEVRASAVRRRDQSDCLAMRALQLYTPNVDKAGYEKSVQRAAAWLTKAEPKTHEDRIWRLLGLAWIDKDKDAIQKAMRELIKAQHTDGGWSDISTLPSAHMRLARRWWLCGRLDSHIGSRVSTRRAVPAE